jgi:hypothetical protein
MQIKQLPSNTAKLNLSGSQTVTRNEFAIIGDAAATFCEPWSKYQSCTCFNSQKRCPYDEVETEVQKLVREVLLFYLTLHLL